MFSENTKVHMDMWLDLMSNSCVWMQIWSSVVTMGREPAKCPLSSHKENRDFGNLKLFVKSYVLIVCRSQVRFV